MILSKNNLKILFINENYYPTPGGSGVVMKNLIESLSKSNVKGIITRDSKQLYNINRTDNGIPIYKINKEKDLLNGRGVYFLNTFFFNSNLNKIIKIIHQLKPTIIIGVFPSANFLLLSIKASEKTGIPLIPYLHDTIEEGLKNNRRYRKLGENLEKSVFNHYKRIFVMSDGMKDLYLKKYKIETIPLRHSYISKKEIKPLKRINNNIFFGGNIYEINYNSIRRISIACHDLNMNFVIASKIDNESLINKNISGSHINRIYLNRDEYIQTITFQNILLIALDFPEETTIHDTELSTAFSTKAIEYMNSGRPILVHAPAHYFISKFFNKNKCGLVVSEKSVESIKKAILKLTKDNNLVDKLTKNAIQTAKIFETEKITDTFYATLLSD